MSQQDEATFFVRSFGCALFIYKGESTMKLSNYIPPSWIDFLICWLLGLLGVHKFREKKIAWGIVYLCTCGLFFFGWIYDLAKYLTIAICQTLHTQKQPSLNASNSQSNDMPNFQSLAKKVALVALGFALVFCVLIASCSSNKDSTTEPTEHITEHSTETITTPSTETITQPTIEGDSTTTTEPATTPSTTPSTEPTPPTATEPVIESTAAPTAEPPHMHSFSAATCTSPKTCSCGATEGALAEHSWQDATYTSPKTCATCGATEGNALDVPGKENYHGHVYTGGDSSTKYHYEADCAGKYSHEITWEEVERRGLEPCATCVLN